MSNKKRQPSRASMKDIAEFREELGRPGELPPDPDGYFTMMAGRASRVLDFYDTMPNCFERDEVVGFLILDLLHLCDRDAELGGVDKAYLWAIDMYDRLVEQSRDM
jgi:hypothetical protein